MSSEPFAVRVFQAGKCYAVFDKPADRLRQFLAGLYWRLTGWRLKPLYREFHALRDISLDVGKGETVGIIGRNGSGKSTLLQLICGTLHPTNGKIEINGRVAALLELGSGFNPEFSGRENVFLNASVLGLTREQTQTRFPSIAAFADIGEFMDQPVKTYSSGMAMRLAFAVIAHVDADILIIDEALAVGDAFFTQKCMRFLRNFMKSGTVLLASHDIEAVKALCPRVIWLDKGALVQDGPTKNVCQAYLDALLEDLPGRSELPKRGSAAQVPAAIPTRDPRLDFLNMSNLRNDVRVFNFHPEGTSPGVGGATIREVRLLHLQGRRLTWVIGGEMVQLEVEAECLTALASPVLGFVVKDRTGQALFGDNTWLSFMDKPIATAPGNIIKAGFVFEMPRLPSGDYSTVVAIADGSQDEHVHHHWIHDALHFRSESSSVVSGLIGIPMREIRLETWTP